MNKRQVKKWLAGKPDLKESSYERKPYMMVRLEYGKVAGVGFAKQNPTDEYDPQVGYYRARNRALDDMTEQVMRRSAAASVAFHNRVNGISEVGDALQAFTNTITASFGQVV